MKTNNKDVRHTMPSKLRKRYCQILELKDDAALIAEYIDLHSEKKHWKQVRDGIREVGILEMEIYLAQNHVFMIVETDADFEWDAAFAKLAQLPRQEEWEHAMQKFQRTAGKTSAEKWKRMDRIFYLYED
ncbi:L-rhamnose mutarotase [Sphingobacterium suaedae]|uniref:L-rhamnose mutarotase n=1 Tax=Sphingobacterium suaedae TaxID=1686402 RepID=A0ABW5KL63_9SPHI